MKVNKPELIVEIANSHNGDFNLLKKTIDKYLELKYDKKSIKLQIFKYDKIATNKFSYYSVYKKLYQKKNRWYSLIDYLHKNKSKIYLDIYDDYGIEVLKKKLNFIKGIKLQYGSINIPKLYEKIKFLKGKDKEIIINITSYTIDEIRVIHRQYSNISKNITLQFGFQNYPTKFENLCFNKIKFLKKNFKKCKISFAEHLSFDNRYTKSLYLLMNDFKIDQLEKHFCLDRSLSNYDYQSALTISEFQKNLKIKKDHKKLKKLKKKIIKETKKNFFINKIEIDLKKIFSSHLVFNKNLKSNEYISSDDIDGKRSVPITAESASIETLNEMFFKTKKIVKKNDPIKLNNIKKINIGAIIMARSNSTRLPKKVFRTIDGVESISLCIKNTKKIKGLNKIILATTKNKEDKKLSEIAKKNKINIFYGDEHNVIKRYYDCSKKFKLDIILRITGDCPVISSDVMNILIDQHIKKNSSFTIPKKATIGSAGEVINFQSLKKVNEHVKKNMPTIKYSEYFRYLFNIKKLRIACSNIVLPKHLISKHRLTTDYASDFTMFNQLFKLLKKKKININLENIIKFLDKNREISKINKNNTVIYKDISFLKKMFSELS